MKNLNIALVALFVGCTSLYGANNGPNVNVQKQEILALINDSIPAALRPQFYQRLDSALTNAELRLIVQDALNRRFHAAQ